MTIPIFSNGKEYISASRASEKEGYSIDYIGQLCRSEKIPGKLIGRTWYIDAEALSEYRKNRRLGKPPANLNLKDRKEGLLMKYEEQPVFKSEESSELFSTVNSLLFEKDDAPLLPVLNHKKNTPSSYLPTELPSLGARFAVSALGALAAFTLWFALTDYYSLGFSNTTLGTAPLSERFSLFVDNLCGLDICFDKDSVKALILLGGREGNKDNEEKERAMEGAIDVAGGDSHQSESGLGNKAFSQEEGGPGFENAAESNGAPGTKSLESGMKDGFYNEEVSQDLLIKEP